MRPPAAVVVLFLLGCGSPQRPAPAVASPRQPADRAVARSPMVPDATRSPPPAATLEPSSRRLEEHASEQATTRGWMMLPLAAWRSERSEALIFWSGTTHANTQLIVRRRHADGSWEGPDGPYPSGVRSDLIEELVQRDGAAVVDRIEGAPPDELGPRIVAALAALRQAVDEGDGVAVATSVRAVGELYCLEGILAGTVIVLLHPVVLEGARARLVRRERAGDRELFWLELVSGQGRRRDRRVLPVPARPVQGAPDRWSFCAP